MRMSFGQEMRMAQKQVLAPRMIQSMEILQLPVMALEERIEEEIQNNETLEVDEADWAAILETNLTGTLRACQVFGPSMIERQWGRIINIASLSSFVALYEVAAYAALAQRLFNSDANVRNVKAFFSIHRAKFRPLEPLGLVAGGRAGVA
jgi:short-subunit dehydrogenase involved in D-alanine esterification of teichoic acids